jgi:hypothetical protein
VWWPSDVSVAEVEHLCALGMRHRLANGTNAVALDENLAGLEQGSGVDLEQAGGVEDDGGKNGACRLLGGGKGRQAG